ncbi:MAG TPA: nuclear transport factor 2 family protein [Rhodanobacteraceae bacterium]|nr:nuclear transport factor 2 family protein [Rhodanobacteraceae bacterium]
MSHPMRFPDAALSLCAVLIVAASVPVAANAAPKADESARTSAAVIAVDQHWLEAEVGGDTAWLDAMLMPDYRTVGANGKVGDKAAILRSATKNRGSDKMRKEVDAWQKSHPTRQSVVLHGDVAILSFSNPETGRILSSDTFIYRNGGWHALYSQHAKVE